jgi:hypothetical protein
MVMIVQGDTNVFNALVYGAERHPNTMQYLQNQASQFSGALTEFGQTFMQGAQQLYETFNSSEAMRAARAAVRKFDAIFLPDRIQMLETIGNLQHAPLTMQRYIMAEPTVRRYFLTQRVDGYSDTYQNVWGNDWKVDHYDWRQIHNGVMEETEEGHVMHHWLDDVLEGDRPLHFGEKVDAIHSGESAAAYIELGREDPTDKRNNKL